MGRPPGKNKLTPKQEAFVREYLLCGNASEALRRAGYKSKHIDAHASTMLKRPMVKACIDEARRRLEEKFEISHALIVKELAAIAFGNIAEMVDADGTLIGDGRALASLSRSSSSGAEGNSESWSLSGYNKVKALELLGRHLGMWRPVKDDDGSGKGSDSANRLAVLKRVSELMRKRVGPGDTTKPDKT